MAGVGLLLAWSTLTFANAPLHVSAPGGMPTGRTIAALALWEELNRHLPEGVWVSPLENEHYEVVSAKWMRRSFLPALRMQMEQLRAAGVPERGHAANCNGFAFLYRALLNLSAMSARAHAPAAATMIVRHDRAFGGLPPTQEGHSVGFVLTDEGPWIIEVQSGVYAPIAKYPNRAAIKHVTVH